MQFLSNQSLASKIIFTHNYFNVLRIRINKDQSDTQTFDSSNSMFEFRTLAANEMNACIAMTLANG